jgi:hypothetical protein
VGAQCAAGDVSAQERMVEANLRLVVHVAYRFQNYGLSMEGMLWPEWGAVSDSGVRSPGFGGFYRLDQAGKG